MKLGIGQETRHDGGDKAILFTIQGVCRLESRLLKVRKSFD